MKDDDSQNHREEEEVVQGLGSFNGSQQGIPTMGFSVAFWTKLPQHHGRMSSRTSSLKVSGLGFRVRGAVAGANSFQVA